MEAKQNADAVERKENPSSRSASTPRSACSVTRRMSSAAAGKLVEESASKPKSSHRAAEGEEEEEGAARVGKGAGHRGGERGRQRDGGEHRRGQRDRRHGGGRRGRGQVGERVRHGGGGVGGRGGGSERGTGLGGEGKGHGEGAGQGGEGAEHEGDDTGHGGDGAGHGRVAAESGGRPSRPGFVWQLGSRLEAKDFMNNWYSAKIINIDDRDNTVLIHFDGWNQRYDEWVKMDSARLRPLTRHSDRRKKSEKTSPKSKPIYKVGENVYARWSDCRMYPAKIVAVNTNGYGEIVDSFKFKSYTCELANCVKGSYEVMYEDGVKKTVQSINVDMKPPLSSIGSGIRPEESTGKRTRYVSPDGASRDTSLTGVSTEEKLKTNRKVRGCSVRVKRCLSTSLEDENDVVCKKETVSVAGEEQHSAVEVKMDDQDIKDEKTGIEHQQQQQQSTEDVASDSSPVKRRLIHVKTLHGKLKKTAPSSPAVPVDSKAEVELGTKLKCPHSDCNKVFRNSTLVQYHIKYYHPEDKIDDPLTQPPEKRRSASSFSESPASLHEFPSKKTKRSKTVDGHIICPDTSGGDEALGLADHSMLSSSQSSVVPPHSSPSPQGCRVIPKESFVGRSKANCRRMRHARKKHRISRMRDRSVNKKVINCLCEVNRETSQLIQCSVCLCWQHLRCLEEEETNLTRRYICKMCTHPPGLRESAKYSFDQDWLVEGRLADYDGSLGGAATVEPAYGLAGKAKIMKITHQLVADLHGVRQVIDSVNRCIVVAREKVEPEFSHWKIIKKENETVGPVEDAKDVQLLSPYPSVDSRSRETDEQLISSAANGCALRTEECGHSIKLNQSSTEGDQKPDKRMEHQHPGDGANGRSITQVEKQEKDADVDGAVDTSSCSAAANNPVKDAVVLNSTAVQFDNLPGGRPSTKTVSEKEAVTCSGRKLLNVLSNSQPASTNEEDLENNLVNGTKLKVQVNADDNLLEDAEENETEDDKIDEMSGSVTSSADEGEEEEDEEIDSCQNHLLHYISQLQDGIEESIAMIEEQVTALESAEGNGNSTEDILRDLPRVKKTMNQLMTDVGKVQQISFCQ